MDGIWNYGITTEQVPQAQLTRHRLLTVNTGTTVNDADASAFTSFNPNFIVPNSRSSNIDKGAEGGPHFVLSGRTPDDKPTYGFEFSLFNDLLFNPANFLPGGITLTIWVLILSTQFSDGFADPGEWAAFQTLTGVQPNELFHTFDVNTPCIRFQFGNIDTNGSITIGLAEL